MCGEQVPCWPPARPSRGSPPRVRGTVGVVALDRGLHRITPACAGNRLLHRLGQLFFWDHPRVCGEQFSGEDAHEVRVGSPPRVRGTGGFYPGQHSVCGITPACAGNSWTAPGRIGRSRDHPRVCGEQMRDIHTRCREEGSPPRVRGTA